MPAIDIVINPDGARADASVVNTELRSISR